MDVRAAVAMAAGKPLAIETVTLAAPRASEVLVEIKATGICHTGVFALSGDDPEGLLPAIFGQEGAGGVKGRTQVPKTADWYMDGKIDIDDLITHTLPPARINEGFDPMRRGESIRSVVVY
jgi:Zn-dependent alcohol dehydrogenase